MDILAAMPSDVDGIMELIHQCTAGMEANGIFQWSQEYPNRDIVAADIAQGALFLLKSDHDYVGMITVNEDQPQEYASVQWLSETGSNLIIHRLAIHPQWQGQGAAMKLMDFAEDYAQKNEYRSVRLDAYTANPRANGLYEKRGYKKVGHIVIPMREFPFTCYEKVMTAREPLIDSSPR